MRPQTLQKLKHGDAITGANFPTFVETYNYTVERCDNLKGDKDVNPQSGIIRVDNTDPEHPVIRCDLPETYGSGGAGGEVFPSAFEYTLQE